MSGGLLALLDDVAALAKVAAASLDDVAAQAVKASTNAAGIVIDDAAVTPRYVVGFAAERELPIIAKIAAGSVKNKIVYLLPAALALSFLAPWAITPLLMLGGVYLCFEGYEKVHEMVVAAPEVGPSAATAELVSGKLFEDRKVASAIQTDIILSAEIMALTLASVPAEGLVTQTVVLATVGVLVTAGVYGVVALIVKADDVGLALAQNSRPASTLLGLRRGDDTGAPPPTALDRRIAPLARSIGCGLVYGMPRVLKVLSVIGTLAMLWVGGGIIVHGLAEMGWTGAEHFIERLAHVGAERLPLGSGALSWIVHATLSALLGIVIGAVSVLAWSWLKPYWPTAKPDHA